MIIIITITTIRITKSRCDSKEENMFSASAMPRLLTPPEDTLETMLRHMPEESQSLNALNIRGTSLPRKRHRSNMMPHDIDFSDCIDLWIEKELGRRHAWWHRCGFKCINWHGGLAMCMCMCWARCCFSACHDDFHQCIECFNLTPASKEGGAAEPAHKAEGGAAEPTLTGEDLLAGRFPT